MAQSGTEPAAVSFYVRECGAILVGALAVIVFLALVTYVPVDQLSNSSSSHFDNIIGSVGAATAFGGYWALGIATFLVPLGMIASCVVIIRWQTDAVNWLSVGCRVGGALLLVFGTTMLATLHTPEFAVLPAGSGGNIGGTLVSYSIEYVNTAGLTILAFVGVLIALQLMIGFSWINVVEWIGRWIVKTSAWLAHAIQWVYNATVSAGRTLYGLLKTEDIRSTQRSQSRIAADPVRIAPTIAIDKSDSLDQIVPGREWTPLPVDPRVVDDPSSTSVSAADREQSARVRILAAPPRSSDEPTVLNKLPSLEILATPSGENAVDEREQQALIALGDRLRMILADYGVAIEVESIIAGPVVSRFEIQLAPGLKVNKIISLANDLAREIAVRSVRVVPVISGKSVVGIEIPNRVRATVTLKEVLARSEFNDAKRPLTLALGKDIAGEPVYADLERMPHLLVAGTTGSGKSVGINTMLLSLMYRLTPDDVRLILVDPKMLELSVYEGIPHLLTPVVTDMQDAARALQWCVAEMERRYRLMKELKVRNLGGFNEKIAAAEKAGELLPDPLWQSDSGEDQQVLTKLPLIVVVIDEFADMIMIVGKKVEQLIARIAQKARAAGIHLILATQRPSVDVITGLIKANIPSRISYQVSSQVDSRTIIDQVGAEQLLGHGDMLFLPPGSSVPERVHGAFVSDDEVLAVIADWRQRGSPQYVYDMMNDEVTFDSTDLGFDLAGEDVDDLYQQAVQFVMESRRASASALQTKFQIGWNKAARFMDQMEQHGVVTEPDQKGRREVLAPED